MASRIPWIDTVRGIGIFLVVLGHFDKLPNFVGVYIYTFHMSLFFFLSGFLFSPSKHPSYLSFIQHKFKKLIIPYIFYSTLTFSFYLFTHTPNLSQLVNLLVKFIIGLFYSIRGTPYTQFSGAMWFLYCLFFTEIFFYLIHRFFSHSLFKFTLIMVLFIIIGNYLSHHYRHPLIGALDVVPIALPFYFLGYLIKEFKLIERLKPNILYLILFFSLNFIFGTKNTPATMYSSVYGNIILYYLSAFSGIFMVIIFSLLIKPVPFVSFMGRNSLSIMGLHYNIGFDLISLIISRTFLDQIFFPINYSSRLTIALNLFQLTTYSFLYSLTLIAIITPLIIFIIKIVSFIKYRYNNKLYTANI